MLHLLALFLLWLLAAAPAQANHPYDRPLGCVTQPAGGADETPLLGARYAGVRYWSKMPLKVYVQPGPFRILGSLPVPGVDGLDYRGAAERAMAMWERATGNVVRFQVAKSLGEADILVGFYERTALTRHAGAATGPGLGFSNVLVGVFPSESGSGYTEAVMTDIALHEFGHSLGLDHSERTSSAMFPGLQLKDACPGPGDVASLNRIYGFLK